MGYSDGGRVRKFPDICLHNNAIVERNIPVINIALWDTRTTSAPSIVLVLLQPHLDSNNVRWGRCRKKSMVVARVNVHFSILNEYKRRRNEAVLMGCVACFPEKFEDVKLTHMQFKAF